MTDATGRAARADGRAPDVVDAIRADLRGAADPARAPAMQRYMKSALPFLGVGVPRVRALVRARVGDGLPDDLTTCVRTLWDEARFREERYAALALLDVPAARPAREPSLVGLHEHLIVTGAWWDLVDETAHRVGELLQAFRPKITPVVRGWCRSPDRWLRRVSVICQLDLRADTDLGLLSDAILANAADPDPFLRKAIGWALRQHARTDPDWVRAFVDAHELSGLSRREALKHLR